jgi:hypothetical protein
MSPEMPIPAKAPEAEGLEIVLVGSFNPAIFHPEWFLRHQLIGPNDSKESDVKVVSADVTEVNFCGIRLQCFHERLSLQTSNASVYDRLIDITCSIISLLPHTPITACGVNPSVHFRINDEVYWHKIGHLLAPKELVWEKALKTPGLRMLVINAKGSLAYDGDTNVTIEPSAKYPPGIYVGANLHFPVKEKEKAGCEIIGFLNQTREKALLFAKHLAYTIFSNIPEK